MFAPFFLRVLLKKASCAGGYTPFGDVNDDRWRGCSRVVVVRKEDIMEEKEAQTEPVQVSVSPDEEGSWHGYLVLKTLSCWQRIL